MPPITDKPAYLLTVILLAMIGAILIGTILTLRPAADPLLIITAVSGFVASIGAGVLSYMKSQETHMLVNSRMDEWMAAQDKVSRAEGVVQGTSDEQSRVSAEESTRTHLK